MKMTRECISLAELGVDVIPDGLPFCQHSCCLSYNGEYFCLGSFVPNYCFEMLEASYGFEFLTVDFGIGADAVEFVSHQFGITSVTVVYKQRSVLIMVTSECLRNCVISVRLVSVYMYTSKLPLQSCGNVVHQSLFSACQAVSER